jgi:Carboxypeptidase regulatory-like domain
MFHPSPPFLSSAGILLTRTGIRDTARKLKRTLGAKQGTLSLVNSTKVKLSSAFCLIFLLGLAHPAPAQAPDAYVNKNPTEPKLIKVSAVDGIVRDPEKITFPNASILLFAEQGHALIETVKSDGKGHFAFGKIPPGHYRVVAKVDGLCPANIPIEVETSVIAHRKIEFVMQPQGIDICSYAIAK